jgi:hypothetical protein
MRRETLEREELEHLVREHPTGELSEHAPHDHSIVWEAHHESAVGADASES